MKLLFTLSIILFFSSCSTKKEIRVVIEKNVKEEGTYPIYQYNTKSSNTEITYTHDSDQEIDDEINNHFDSIQTDQEKEFFNLGSKAPDLRIFFNWPLTTKTITSKFGNRRHPITKKMAMHKGIDFRAKSGTPVYASQDGVVIISKNSGSYGNVVAIAHSGGFVTLYGHNKDNLVKKGDIVVRNQKISTVGSTGNSTGAHLHFEIIKNKQQLDPYKFLMNQTEYFKR